MRRIVDRHFRPFKSHQRRRPCSCYRIAQGIEDAKVWRQSSNFSNCSLVQRGVGWSNFALLVMTIRKQTGPPLNPVAAAAIPEMNFLTRRKPDIGVAGEMLVNPGRTGFLCTDPEKVEHINVTPDAALDMHLDARADRGTHAR